jgi:serine/threonine-protein kinase SRPK3
MKVELETAYGTDGLHPIKLGDLVGPNQRYCVLHKLGHNTNSTVWLVKDTEATSQQYLALRIVSARDSNNSYPELRTKRELTAVSVEGQDTLGVHIDEFLIEGPNGLHLCLTYTLLRPTVTSCVSNPVHQLRRTCFDIVSAVNVLHSNDIIHGSKLNLALS